MAPLPQKPYGMTGDPVTVIGLGGAGVEKHSLDQGVATVQKALDLGVGYFDTAPAYGASQAILGKSLQGKDEDYTLATKIGYLSRPEACRSVDALRTQLGRTSAICGAGKWMCSRST